MAERSGRKIYRRRWTTADSSEGTVTETATIDIYILQRSAAIFSQFLYSLDFLVLLHQGKRTLRKELSVVPDVSAAHSGL